MYTANGAKIFIGPSVTEQAADTTAEFAALTYVEVGYVESIGAYGDTASEVTAAVLGDGRTRKAKGARNSGTLPITCLDQPDDLGQLALVAAEAQNSANYALKIVLPNRLNATGADQIDYMRVLVMSKSLDVGANDHIVRRTFNAGINSQIYTVAPTAGV
jgi:hypothetical protein